MTLTLALKNAREAIHVHDNSTELDDTKIMLELMDCKIALKDLIAAAEASKSEADYFRDYLRRIDNIMIELNRTKPTHEGDE